MYSIRHDSRHASISKQMNRRKTGYENDPRYPKNSGYGIDMIPPTPVHRTARRRKPYEHRKGKQQFADLYNNNIITKRRTGNDALLNPDTFKESPMNAIRVNEVINERKHKTTAGFCTLKRDGTYEVSLNIFYKKLNFI